jgi:hypothetical protein
LALIENIKKGTQLLSKITGANLNPAIALTYSSLVNTFSAGLTITDSNGSTAVIISDNGSSMILKNVSIAGGYTALAGTITASSGGLTSSAVIDTFNWGDQVIELSGGKTFIITDIVLTNASAVPVNAFDVEWWSEAGRTGTMHAISVLNAISGFLTGPTQETLPLGNANQYMSISNGGITYPVPATGNSLSTSGPVIYFTVGTPEGNPLTCDMYIYGYVLN